MSDAPSDFIRDMIRADVAAGKHGGKVVTRFPPEPNGYLHIGHAKAICIDFGVAKEFGGRCHLRMDDTNPTTEDISYVEAIKRDVKWLGFDWGEHLYYASDYFERFYELAEKLIRSAARTSAISRTRSSPRATAAPSPRPARTARTATRSVDENLDLFRRMREGEFKDGEKVLRAKIDMSSPNMKMRDPPLVRIKHAHHYRTGDAWCIYPLYDYAHCLEDSFEGVTHSLCTMEFESARELYDWVIQATEVPHVPKQTEFARLNLTYTVMSKRKLLQLVEQKLVSGWDDPRMPTIAGLPPPRLHARVDPRLHRRRSASRRTSRRSTSRSSSRARATTSTALAARHGRARSRSSSSSSRSPRTRSRSSTRRTGRPARSPRPTCAAALRGEPQAAVLADAPHRSRRLRRGPAAGLEAPRAGSSGAPAPRLHRDVHARREGRTGEITRVFCTHDPATRGGVAAGREARRRHDPLGRAPRTRRTSRSASTIGSSRPRTPARRGHATGSRSMNPASLSVVQAKARAEPRAGEGGRSLPVRARRLLLRRSRHASPARRSSTAPSRSRTAGRSRRAKAGAPTQVTAPAAAEREARGSATRSRRRVAAPLSPEAQALVDAPRPHGRRGARPRAGAAAPRALRRRGRARRRERSTRRRSRRCSSTISSARCARRSSTTLPFDGAALVELVAARSGRHDLDEAVEGRPRGDDRDRQAARAPSSRRRA